MSTLDDGRYSVEQWAQLASQTDQELQAEKAKNAKLEARLAELEPTPELTPQQGLDELKSLPRYGEPGWEEAKAKAYKNLRRAGAEVSPYRAGQWR
jgi:hypothetical protein